MVYKNPNNWSDQRLRQEIDAIKEEARKSLRSFQKARQRKSLYSADFEGLAARNKQTFGTEQLPKRLPETREGMELYFKRAQEMLNLGSTTEKRAFIREQASDFFSTSGISFDWKSFKYDEQKALSDFLHSDEWKSVYAYSSAYAMQLINSTLVGHPKPSNAIKNLYATFKHAYADIQG